MDSNEDSTGYSLGGLSELIASTKKSRSEKRKLKSKVPKEPTAVSGDDDQTRDTDQDGLEDKLDTIFDNPMIQEDHSDVTEVGLR